MFSREHFLASGVQSGEMGGDGRRREEGRVGARRARGDGGVEGAEYEGARRTEGDVG